ncbi:MAG: GDSL-type esterase/lipase family protein [bacterium]|nr:GDSL-type esterase/lipase family protein [bacterium]
MSAFDLLPAERLLPASDPLLQHTGRMDMRDPAGPVWQFPACQVRMRLRGSTLRMFVSNTNHYYESRLGVMVNGCQHAVLLPQSGDAALDLSVYLTQEVNDILLFKRQDGSHTMTLRGFAVERAAQLLPLPARPARRMEFYGDSVTAGEVTEAIAYAGQCDPPHQGQYSNAWWGYAWQTARLLDAELHDTAQGGIALLDRTGWFNGPDYVGMESCWDKALYNPSFGVVTPWDFSRYVPHVVVVALGQNDANPRDYMASDPTGADAQRWKRAYRDFILRLRARYQGATIILTTTILGHDRAWDDAIDEVCRGLAQTDSRIHHFLYTNNGCGTPGHIRKTEAAVMAQELAGFIRSLGDGVWEDASAMPG